MSRSTKSFFQMLSSSREAKERIPDIMTLDDSKLNSIEDINKRFFKYFNNNMTDDESPITIDDLYDIFIENHSTEYEHL